MYPRSPADWSIRPMGKRPMKQGYHLLQLYTPCLIIKNHTKLFFAFPPNKSIGYVVSIFLASLGGGGCNATGGGITYSAPQLTPSVTT